MAQMKFQAEVPNVRFVCKNSEYLREHEELIQQATAKLNEYFNPLITTYVLSTINDPETRSQIPFLEVQTAEKYDVASAALENFENDWLLDNSTDLVIDVTTL